MRATTTRPYYKSWAAKITSNYIRIKLENYILSPSLQSHPMFLWALHCWSQAGRCFAGAGSHPDPTTCGGSSYWSCVGYVRLIQICSSHLQVAWPPAWGAPYGYKNDSLLPHVHVRLSSLVGFAEPEASERSRINRLLACLRRAGYLPTDFLSFEDLARLAVAGLFRATCSNT